jgi:hypothetical protein
MGEDKQTVKLCSELLEPNNPRSPRCLLPAGHAGDKPHTAIGPDGRRVEWETKQR